MGQILALKSGSYLVPVPKYKPAPKELNAFPEVIRAKSKTPNEAGGLSKRWKDSDRNIFEWDSQHGRVEKYSSRGKHQGEFDAETGSMTKPVGPTRTVGP